NGISQTVGSLSNSGLGGGVVTNAAAAPVSLTLADNSGSSNIFTGSIKDTSGANAISLIKTGNSVQILAGVNAYRGGTTLSAGTLLVNGTAGSGGMTAFGGTLGGNGTINGPAIIQSGATLSPGPSIGALTLGNGLILAAGSTTFIE